MTEPAPAPASVTTIEHGEASKLPELGWFWRRGYVFVVTAVLLAHVWWTSLRTEDVVTLRMTIRNDQGLLFVLFLLYLAGATTEAIAKLLAAVKTTRKETVTEAPPPAILTPKSVSTLVAPAGLPDKPGWTR